MKITADFTNITGRIKPMHGVGQPPMSLWVASDAYFHYLEEAGIPYSRLHDTGGRYGAGVYVDIPNIFRSFDADENDPANYDFRSTDKLLTDLKKHNVEPFYRLGITIENDAALCSYRNFPPKDPEKWARICEHVVAHYNDGWANGYHLGITYWEIWNEPDGMAEDGSSQMWKGTKEQYYALYTATAKRLKARFGDTIKVGGYASCGFYAINPDSNGNWSHNYFITFFRGFLEHVKKEGAPLDFFSWHSYDTVPRTVNMERYCRKVLAEYGFDGVEDIMNEWNTCIDDRRFTHYASAQILSMMLAMQKERIAELNYYDASMGLMRYSGLFSGDTNRPLPSYFAFMMFNQLYMLQNEVATASDDPDIYVGAAVKGDKKVLLIANRKEAPIEISLDLTGADVENAEILRIDDTYTYSPTGKKIKNHTLTLSPLSCTEIRF